jgi:AraC family transcriptional regulator of adaptative response / DNA-3-methyladenine glycosylase II
VRRFNETFQTLYGRPPSTLRRRGERTPSGGLTLSLPYRAPYDVPAMMTSLARRGVEDETVQGEVWTRRLCTATDGVEGEIAVRAGGPGRLAVSVELSSLKALPGVLARVRRVFDLAADPEAIARDLSVDPVLAKATAERAGLRPPGDWLMRDELPSDRLETNDPALLARAEGWRPWRAYGALYWRAAMDTGEAR